MLQLPWCYGFPPARVRQHRCGCIVSGFAMLVMASAALSQPYPTRPIRLVVPFAAGGTADVVARAVTNEVGAQFGQAIVLDGLYFMIGEQEKAFRQNPLGATSDMVKNVFGALGR